MRRALLLLLLSRVGTQRACDVNYIFPLDPNTSTVVSTELRHTLTWVRPPFASTAGAAAAGTGADKRR